MQAKHRHSCFMLNKTNILLGVSAGIAAYKSAYLASMLVKAGAVVRCILTENACKLIAPRTFEALTNQAVITDLWTTASEHKITHINIIDQTDIIVVAPATANIIAKAACGIADDMLSTTLCAGWNKPTIYAPAMNTKMWTNPATCRNIQTLEKQGCRIVGPEKGYLACGTEDIGRMSEPQAIFDAITQMAQG